MEQPPSNWAYLNNNGIMRGFTEKYARGHIEALRGLDDMIAVIETDRMTIFRNRWNGLIGWVAESLLEPDGATL